MKPDALKSMRKGIEDSAYGGTMHQYLPWYGVTAGGILGGAAGAKLMPKKYQLLGTLGGGLLGTAAGLHGGEAIGKRLDRMKKTARVLSAKGRGQIKEKNFALPGGRYPIHDSGHARNALTRVRQFGTPEEKSKVYAAVGKKYPGLAARSSLEEVREKSKKKQAEAEEYKPPHPALTAAKSIGGLGVGMLAGYGGMQATDAILQKARGKGLPRGSKAMWAVPIATGAGGLAYTHMQQKTLEKMRQDHLKRQEKKRGREES